MIAATAWDGRRSEEVEPDHIEAVLRRGHRMVWIDATDPTPDEIDRIATWFSLSPLAVEDLRTPDERPKIEVYDEHTLLVAFTPELTELGIVVGGHSLLTVHPSTGSGWDLGHVARRFARSCHGKATPGFLLYTLLDELVDGYLVRADGYEDAIEDLEDGIFGETAQEEQEIQARIFGLRREIVRFRRKVVPLRDVVSQTIRDDMPGVGEELTPLYRDVYDHLLRTVDVLDSQRELLGNAVEAHLGIMSNNMNSVMKKMTSWGALLLGSTLVAGIYGMNFQHMPELGWQLGYGFALGVMALLTATGYLLFKRKGWL